MTTRALWEKMCYHNVPYLMIVATWVLPILISLPESFESDVEFTVGTGAGDICCVVEGGNVTFFSDVQYFTNLTTEVVLLAIITVCYVIICWRLRRLAKQAKEELDRALLIGDGYSERQLGMLKRHIKSL